MVGAEEAVRRKSARLKVEAEDPQPVNCREENGLWPMGRGEGGGGEGGGGGIGRRFQDLTTASVFLKSWDRLYTS